MTFLVAALACFVAFHLLPSFDHKEGGWGVWPALWREVQNPKSINSLEALIMACFLNFALLMAASPFLSHVWPKSRLAWWSATVFSGLTAVGFWGIVLWKISESEARSLGAGGWSLLAASLLNFFGLVLARGKAALVFPAMTF